MSGADADRDGYTNQQEYLTGTDPLNANSFLRLGEVAQRSLASGGGVAVSWASVDGRSYTVERSYNLTDWSVLQSNVAATPPLNTVVDLDVPPQGRGFYRLSVP